MATGYRIFGTTADFGVASKGKDMKEAFENQAAGMFAAMVNLRSVRPAQKFNVEARGEENERLLASFLEELLFIFDAKQALLREFNITLIGNGMLKAEAWGEPIDPERHVIKTPIKAVTHHRLEVKADPEGVSTRVIYDI